MKQTYNCKPDAQDVRDLFYLTAITQIPRAVDLRTQCSAVVNQEKIGSCTANALAGALEFLELHELRTGKGPEVFDSKSFSNFSRLFVYYNERFLEGTVEQDYATELRASINLAPAEKFCGTTNSIYFFKGLLILHSKKPANIKSRNTYAFQILPKQKSAWPKDTHLHLALLFTNHSKVLKLQKQALFQYQKNMKQYLAAMLCWPSAMTMRARCF